MEKLKKYLVPKILVPVVIILALVLVYVIGCFYYSSNFLPRTNINGRAYGGKSLEYVEQDIQRPLITELTLLGKENVEETLDLTSVECKKVISPEQLQQIKAEQKPWLWFVEFFVDKNYNLEFELDCNESMLESAIESLAMVSGKDVVAPKNADIVLGQSGYEVIPAEMGNTLDKNELKSNVVNAIVQKENSLDLEKCGVYLTPEVTEDCPEIKSTEKQLDKISNIVLTYDFKDRQEILDYNTIIGWIDLNDKGELEIDEEKAKEYILGLARTYDTLHTVRQFNTSHGFPISIGGGIYGWQTNINKSTEALVENILAGESKTVQPVYTTSALERGSYDIGNTYVEIDLTNQHMWFYKNGALVVDTPVVTGLPGTWRETPTGVFAVWSKETNRYLKGDDYKLWVDYWLPIDWTGVGIHDATWQPSFGGDTYLVYGSHGCINTPPPACAVIFNNIEELTPVIIYKA